MERIKRWVHFVPVACDKVGGGAAEQSAGFHRLGFDLFSKSSKFTDNSVITIALADAIINQRSYGKVIVEYARRYPKAGYGSYFRCWLKEDVLSPTIVLVTGPPCGLVL